LRIPAGVRQARITELGSVVLFPWTAGNWGPEDAADRGRLIRLQATVSRGADDNYYARAIEGIIVTVELERHDGAGRDHGVVPIPSTRGTTPRLASLRLRSSYFPNGLRMISRPSRSRSPRGQLPVEGTGHGRMCVPCGFHPREGLVLHLVEYLEIIAQAIRKIWNVLRRSECQPGCSSRVRGIGTNRGHRPAPSCVQLDVTMMPSIGDVVVVIRSSAYGSL